MSLDNLADFIQRREQALTSRRQHILIQASPDAQPLYHWVDTNEPVTFDEIQAEQRRVRAAEVAVEKEFAAALAAHYVPRLSPATQDQVFDTVWNLTSRLDDEDQFEAVAAEYSTLAALINRAYDEGAAR